MSVAVFGATFVVQSTPGHDVVAFDRGGIPVCNEGGRSTPSDRRLSHYHRHDCPEGSPVELTTGDNDTTSGTTSEAFDVLQNRRRLDGLVSLAGTENSAATLGVPVEHVAVKKGDIRRKQLSFTQRKRVYIGPPERSVDDREQRAIETAGWTATVDSSRRPPSHLSPDN